MSADAWVSPSHPWLRDDTGGERARKRRMPQLLEAALLTGLFFAMLGVLSLRHERTVALGQEEAYAQQAQDRLYGTIRTPTASRSDFRNHAPAWYYRLESPPTVGDREQVFSAVPVGQAYEVLVKGRLTARLADNAYAAMPRGYVAYLFEMRYRRWIESNDGARIVERRTYGNVQMAKILSSVPMRLAWGPAESLSLDALAFPAPGTGIAVAAVRPVAQAMLGSGAPPVADEPASRAFLEQDLLSGKSVRLTHIDGVGVSAIEPLGWTLTKPVAAHLFSQTILPPPLPVSGPLGGELVDGTVRATQFTAFLDPTRFLVNRHEIAVRSLGEVDESSVGYELLLLPWLRDMPGQSADPEYRSAAIRLGYLQYDPDQKVVTHALIEWPLYALHPADERLCFERECQGVPVLTVQYHGRTD